MLSWRGPFHPRRGGAEVYTERVLRGLAERGHDVTWFAAAHPGAMPADLNGVHLAYGGRNLGVYLAGHLWLRRTRQSGAWDIVVDQVNTFGFAAPKVWRDQAAPGVPAVACLIHQLAADVWDAEVPWPANVVGRRAERSVLSWYRATPFMTMCQSTIDELRGWGWRGTGYVTPTGIDKITSCEKSLTPALCFLGRFDAKAKRLDHALAIQRQIRQVLPQCELWVIGRGDPPKWLREGDGVRIYANVSDEKRDQLLGAAWCCVATSVREGWGRMVTESGAAGTATVGYDVPGLRDAILHGSTGFLVSPDPDAAARKLLELLAAPDTLFSLGRAAQEQAARVTWGRSTDDFEEALMAICRTPSSYAERS